VVIDALQGSGAADVTILGRDEADQTLHKVGDGQSLADIPRLVFAARR
jgi:hypothetical protein